MTEQELLEECLEYFEAMVKADAQMPLGQAYGAALVNGLKLRDKLREFLHN